MGSLAMAVAYSFNLLIEPNAPNDAVDTPPFGSTWIIALLNLATVDDLIK